MAGAGKLSAQIAVKSGVVNYWNVIMDYVTLFPKVAPTFYKSVQVLQGDGISVGSVRLIHFGEESPLVRTATEEVEELDTVNKKLTYRVVDGDLMKYFKTYKIHTEVVSNENGSCGEGDHIHGSLVNWLCEFEKLSPEIPEPTIVRDNAIKFFKELDAYLLKASI